MSGVGVPDVHIASQPFHHHASSLQPFIHERLQTHLTWMTSTGSAPDIVFRGRDGTEAEEFIAAIEELAFAEGWSEHQNRMLLFARSRLRQKALRWFAKLDPSKASDWKLFVEALFEQYPSVEAPTEAEIATPVWSATTFSPSVSTAILPSDQGLDPRQNLPDEGHTRRSVPLRIKTYDPSIRGRQVGILRIVQEDETTLPEYICRGRPQFERTNWDQLRTTIDRREALVVCFIATPEPHPIGCLNAAHNLLDLYLFYYLSGESQQYSLHVGNGVQEIPQNGPSHGYYYSKVWNVASDGSLEASLSAYGPKSYGNPSSLETFKTSEVHLDTSGASLRFAKPGTPLWQNDPKPNNNAGRYDVLARIVFEPF